MDGKPIVLVADDERHIRDLYKAILGTDYDVRTAVDGKDALDKLNNGSGDAVAVVTDVRMPNMDGPTLISRLREANHPVLNRGGVLVVTGTPGDLGDMVLGPNIQTMTKPVDIYDFAARVRGMVNRTGGTGSTSPPGYAKASQVYQTSQ